MAWRRWIVVGLALGAVGLAMLVKVGFRGLPPCPLHAATGLYCPGCGVTRATNALLHGDLVTAFRMNFLAVILMPFLALMMAREVAAWAWERPKWRPGGGGRWGIALGFTVILYGILRNVPGFEFLAPAPSDR